VRKLVQQKRTDENRHKFRLKPDARERHADCSYKRHAKRKVPYLCPREPEEHCVLDDVCDPAACARIDSANVLDELPVAFWLVDKVVDEKARVVWRQPVLGAEIPFAVAAAKRKLLLATADPALHRCSLRTTRIKAPRQKN
jgi:hypothetical protein